jgi:hypothetical protein
MKRSLPLVALAATTLHAAGATLDGEPREWHKLTLGFSGPATGETATPNPFTDYRLQVTFHHAGSGKTLVVPGYYAADGDAANSSATAGNVWRAHLAPEATGTWTYQVSFRTGANVAMSDDPAAGSSAGHFDGETGSFTIAATDKTGRDFRGKGRLDYVGKHHLRFAETGTFFMKAGVDSPENLLAYQDFDGVFKSDGIEDQLVKDWQPHVIDWHNGDPLWQGSKGKGLIGAVNYLAAEGLNGFSFLTMNINGDDKNVYPYTTYSERLRMDVSKLDQWEIVFEHATRMGMHLHFKTQETENELLLDGGNTGNQRRLYYRELIARFGHHLALNWNLGEEINGASLAQKQAWARYFHDHDPYHHPIVIHNGATHYNMMGDASELTGFSLQLNADDFSDMFSMTKDYLDRSAAAGKPWVVACDEPGDSRLALRPDSDPGTSHTDARRDALWSNILVGGAGCEFYFGYEKAHSDLTCNDFRSRDAFWDYCRHALALFGTGVVPFQDMTNRNGLVSGAGENGNRCLAKDGDTYLVQLRAGGSHTLNLSADAGKTFRVRWFDPRNGGPLVSGNTFSGGGTRSLGSPPDSTTQDWLAVVRADNGGTPANTAPVVIAGPDQSKILAAATVTLDLAGSATDDGLPDGSTLATTWTVTSGPGAVTFGNPANPGTAATFTAAGSYTLRLTATDGELDSYDEIVATIIPAEAANTAPVAQAGLDAAAVLNDSSVTVALNGSATDDGLPVGSPLAFSWSLVSGGPVTFGSASSAATTATFSSIGIHVLRLTATDSLLTHSDDIAIVITVPPPGTTGSFVPTDDAYTDNGANYNSSYLRVQNGSRTRISYLKFDLRSLGAGASSAILRLTEYGDPSSGGMTLRLHAAASNNWTESTITGANAPAKAGQLAVFTGDIPAGTVVAFDVTPFIAGPGIYSFILEADATSRDVAFAPSERSIASQRPSLTVTTTNGSLPPVNAAPMVAAGPDQSLALTDHVVSANLAGSVTDDGLPQGSTLVRTWIRASGPAAVTFADPSSPATTATFPAAGTYVLRLHATDGQLSAADELVVTVIDNVIDNAIPVVNAGPDRSATLSGTAVAVSLAGSASDDGLPEGSTLAVTWSWFSGPAPVVFANPAATATTATFTAAGTYGLRLTATDGELTEQDDMTVTVVAGPSGGTTLTFSPVHDAYTENGKGINTTNLRIEQSSRVRISYLQFNLSALPGPVTAATLRLTEDDDVSSGTMTLRLFAAISNAWTEGTINGTNAPAKGAELAVFTGDITNGRKLDFDVSAFITGPGTFSLILEASPSTRDVALASSENGTTANRPLLTVVTTAAIAPAAAASRPPDDSIARDVRLAGAPGSAVQIHATGIPGLPYRIERSTDLKTWHTLETIIPGDDRAIDFTDPAPPDGSAFYRLASP